jgi:heme o synthase
MREYIELTKPRITWLILMSTAIGYFFGLPGRAGWWEFLTSIPLLSLLHTMIGTGLIASGTAALNQWYERDADRRMKRTAHRPLPAGKLDPLRALAFGVALSAAGFLELWLGGNLLAAAIGAFTLDSYLFI